MTVAAGRALQTDMAKRGTAATLFHSGLDYGEKEKIHEVMGKSVVIATTGQWYQYHRFIQPGVLLTRYEC